MKEVLSKIVDGFESNDAVNAVKKTFAAIMPIIIIGIISDILLSLPIDMLQKFYLSNSIGLSLRRFLYTLNRTTFGIFGLYIVTGVAYNYSKKRANGDLSIMLIAMINALVCFMASVISGDMYSALKYIDVDATVWAIIVGVVSVRLFFLIANKSGSFKYRHIGETDMNTFTASRYILPIISCITIFALFNTIINKMTGQPNVIAHVSKSIIAIYSNSSNSIKKMMMAFLSEDILAFVGVGRNEIMGKIYNVSNDIVTLNGRKCSVEFLNTMTNIGGIGNVLSLSIAIMLFTKSENGKHFVRYSLLPVIFNVNDLMVYGLPVMFNPLLLIPFVLSPLISKGIVYLAIAGGMFSDTAIAYCEVWHNAPVFISGYLATGNNISGVLLQVVLLVVGVITYWPFVKLLEDIKVEKESEIIELMKQEYNVASETDKKLNFINDEDDIGRVSREILEKLTQDIEKENIELFYQPQNGGDGMCYGGEALLRWKYNGEYMFPSLVTEIAKEGDIFRKLCEVIVDKACQDTKLFKEKFGYGIKVSININSNLLNDREFLDYIIGKVNYYGVNSCICLEVTEESSMFNYENITENIRYLAKQDISVAIDDFSMGHTSIKYLQKNQFGYVKLDGSLVKEITTNKRSRDIVEAITKLGKNLDFRVVAEYVDSEEIKNELIDIGCNFLQGYYFSPAINKYKFIEYVLNCNN